MSKFTPGPWLLEGKTIYALEFQKYYRGEEVWTNRFDCWVQGPNTTPQEELEANARLIAKAPQMYATLKEIRQFFELDGDLVEHIDKLLKEIDGE